MIHSLWVKLHKTVDLGVNTNFGFDTFRKGQKEVILNYNDLNVMYYINSNLILSAINISRSIQ